MAPLLHRAAITTETILLHLPDQIL